MIDFMNRRGYSLIELIIGLGLTLVALILFAVVLSTIPLTRNARNQNLAYHIAAKRVEELRRTPFDSLPTSGPFVDSGLLDLASSSASLTVSDYEGDSQIKQVTATVSWYEHKGQKSVVVETLIYELGLSQ